MKYIYIIINLLLLYSCNKDKYEDNFNHPKTTSSNMYMNLIQTGEIQFELDSLTAHLYNASQYIDKQNYYSFLSNTKEILIYDYYSKDMIYKIPTNVDSPCSYEYINKDSIIIADYNTNSIQIINSNGDIQKRIPIKKDIKYYPFPLTRISPIINTPNKIYLLGNICGEYEDENNENRKIISVIDKSSLSTVSKIAYPDIYKKNWGGSLFRWIYADYNPINNLIILSFPADHYIYTTDLNLKNIEAHYAGSSFIDATQSIKKGSLHF